MARINLLPWRSEERERRNKEFLTLVVAVTLLALLAAFATWSYFNNELEEQRDANDRIAQENSRLRLSSAVKILSHACKLFKICKGAVRYRCAYGMILLRLFPQRFISII